MGGDFRFRQFTVVQTDAPMKVGTDGVLLGAWTAVDEGCRRVLDIGTGTGVIALMLAQRLPDADITAIDIDSASVACARRNADSSPWGGRIATVHMPVQEYMPAERFDLIVSNPPFYDDTLPCPDEGRTIARHTRTLPFADLLAAAGRLLNDDGRFAVIVPAVSAGRFVAAGEMHLIRRCDVSTNPSRPPKRTLLEFSKRFAGAVRFESMTVGDEYCRSLTADFYL